MIGPLIAVCAVACAGLLASDRLGSRLGVWICKPLAAAAFVGVGLASGPFESDFGRWILLGLCLSCLGDVLLIPKQAPKMFLAGIGSFLLGHVAYCGAFLSVAFSAPGLALGALIALPGAIFVMRWLHPKLSGVFVHAVPLYVIVIAAMLMLSGSASSALARADLFAGAFMFAASDVSVARDRFVEQAFVNGAWGLPLYFAAQIVLALSIGR